MEYIDRRMAEGLENCRVLQRELRALGYEGSYTILAEYVDVLGGEDVSPRQQCALTLCQGNRPRWTGAVSLTSAPMADSDGYGLS